MAKQIHVHIHSKDGSGSPKLTKAIMALNNALTEILVTDGTTDRDGNILDLKKEERSLRGIIDSLKGK